MAKNTVFASFFDMGVISPVIIMFSPPTTSPTPPTVFHFTVLIRRSIACERVLGIT